MEYNNVKSRAPHHVASGLSIVGWFTIEIPPPDELQQIKFDLEKSGPDVNVANFTCRHNHLREYPCMEVSNPSAVTVDGLKAVNNTGLNVLWAEKVGGLVSLLNSEFADNLAMNSQDPSIVFLNSQDL